MDMTGMSFLHHFVFFLVFGFMFIELVMHFSLRRFVGVCGSSGSSGMVVFSSVSLGGLLHTHFITFHLVLLDKYLV
jgi:hypothetical protein